MKSVRGSSIVEVLIVVAVALGLGLLTMSVLGVSANTQAATEADCIRTLDCPANGSGGAGGSIAGTVGTGQTPTRYGDDRTGLLGALEDIADPQPPVVMRPFILAEVENGTIKPDPSSRLGAYLATAGYPPGSVGSVFHFVIGSFYTALGTFGEERIGDLFNSPEAKALYDQPIDSPAGKQLATLEYNYWEHVREEDPYSPGGNLGSIFGPDSRDDVQRVVGMLPGL